MQELSTTLRQLSSEGSYYENIIFCNAMAFVLVDVYQHFGGTYCHHLQSRRARQTCLLGLVFVSENEDRTFIRNVCKPLSYYMTSHRRRQCSSFILTRCMDLMKTCGFCWKEPANFLKLSHVDTTHLMPQMATGDDPKAVPSNTNPHTSCPSNVSPVIPNCPPSS
jgi:hypothetical protein